MAAHGRRQVDNPLDASLPEAFNGCRSEPVGQILDVATKGAPGLGEPAVPAEQSLGLKTARGLLPIIIAPPSGRLDDLPADSPGGNERQRSVEPAQPSTHRGEDMAVAYRPTAVHFPSKPRLGLDPEERASEIGRWSAAVRDPSTRIELAEGQLAEQLAEQARLERDLRLRAAAAVAGGAARTALS